MKCSLLVLSSYLDGELEARRDGELEAHLVGCQRCRAGLGYLREEVERVSALGRVHVADHSVHALLAQLGLIDEDEPLPEPSPTAVALAEPPGRAPSWMGADDATSMPWALAGPPSPQLVDEPGLVEPVEAVEEELAGVPDTAAFAPPDVTHAGELGSIEVHTAAPPDDSNEPHLADMYAEAALADAPDDGLDDAEPPAPAAQQPHTAPAPDLDRPAFRWVPPMAPAPPTAASAPPDATEYEPPSSPGRPPFTWSSAPTATGPGQPAAAGEEGVPAVPFAFDSGRSQDLPAPSLTPPAQQEHGPPAADATPDQAPAASSGGAFPPGGPEHVDPSDLPEHATAPGGEPEMTASPPWAPHDAPPAGPLYPMTDDDILGEPVPVERFGPPPQAARPSLFERLRDRLAVRRTLSRSSSAYDDQVQIVSGMGAPLRPGRARMEVERRRQETLRMEPGPVPGEAIAGFPDDPEDEVDDELGLGPLPPPFPELHTPMPMPRPPARPAAGPGQMSLPGTSVPDPFDPSAGDWRAPIHRVPMPPSRHSLGGALGELPPSTPPAPSMPPLPPRPPVSPPPAPRPDPLGEALSDFDRPPGGTTYEPRPWRPREVADDVETAPPPRRFAAEPAGPAHAERNRHSPSQLRDGRRLLAIFGAATLVMFVVGIVSGRTTSPRPASSTSSAAPAPAASAKPKAGQPARQPATQGPIALSPNTQSSQAPAGTPQLTGTKLLGDGSSGFQVKDFRYGTHPNDFRIVLDLEGPASGSPKVTIGFLDQTTLLVALTGVTAAGSVGQLPSSNPVTAITLMSQSPFPGATTYQIKLAHPVTFTAGYVPGPLRLVLDLAG